MDILGHVDTGGKIYKVNEWLFAYGVCSQVQSLGISAHQLFVYLPDPIITAKTTVGGES